MHYYITCVSLFTHYFYMSSGARCRSVRRRGAHAEARVAIEVSANLRIKILDIRGSDSIRILSSRGGIPISVGGNSPESLSQAILGGITVVGRLGVLPNLFRASKLFNTFFSMTGYHHVHLYVCTFAAATI